jgi:hypothetical protein
MNMFFKMLFGNFVLNKGPQDLPASRVLMKLSLLVYLLSGLPGLLVSVDFVQAVLAQALDVVVLLLFTYLCLQVFVKPERYTQTIIALASVGAIFQLIVLPILFEFKEVEEASQAMLGMSLLLLALVSWNLTVIAHIFRESFSVRLPAAIVLTISYMFITLSARKFFFPELA